MDWIQPMEPILNDHIMSSGEWIHQVKWDGIRGISYLDHGEFRVFTKKGLERTFFYPEIAHIKRLFSGHQAILDGEIVVLSQQGKPIFQHVLVRERVRSMEKVDYYARRYPVKYIVFDILSLNDQLLITEPLYKRKELLLTYLKQDQTIGITDDFSNGQKLLTLMKDKGWEGIVSKKQDSRYSPGKHHQDWYKTKIYKKMLTVVSGIQWKGDYPNALLLSIFKNQKLQYIGKASLGLKQQDFKLLKQYAGELQQNTAPFAKGGKWKDVTWLKPRLTCWVQYLEWSGDHLLRHPKIIGFSLQKPEEADGKEVIV